MRTHIAVSALAVGLALTGCGQQSLVGQGAMDPESPQLSAEEAQREAARLQEEGGVGHGAESGGAAAGGSGTGETAHGSESGGAASGETASGETASGGTGTTEAEANAGSDEGSGTVTSESGTGTGSGTAQISDEAIAQFEQQFPALSRVVSEQQLRTTATQVCSAISAGGTAAGQQVVETLPGVNATTAQQVVGFFDREVCPR